MKKVAKAIDDCALGEKAMSTLIGDADAIEVVSGLSQKTSRPLKTFFNRLVKMTRPAGQPPVDDARFLGLDDPPLAGIHQRTLCPRRRHLPSGSRL